MDLQAEHQVTLTTTECAALLAAAKVLLEQYDAVNRECDARTTLQNSVNKITAGMGLTPERAAQLLNSMDTGQFNYNS